MDVLRRMALVASAFGALVALFPPRGGGPAVPAGRGLPEEAARAAPRLPPDRGVPPDRGLPPDRRVPPDRADRAPDAGAPEGGGLADRIRRMGTPVWADGRPHLFYVGRARQVEVAGDFTDWYLVPMQRVGRSEVWEAAPDLPPDAVVTYRLRVDGQAQPDPLNPRTTTGLGTRFSVILGPAAPGREPPPAAVPGSPRRIVVQSRYLRRRVTARIWVPPGCGPRRPCPILYAADGPDYTGEGRLPAILAAGRAAGRLPPVVLVAIDPPPDPVLRTAELLPGIRGDAWPRFLAEELVTAVEGRYDSAPDRARRGLLGLSAGAAGMLQAALLHPDRFGVVLAQSPAWLPPVLEETLSAFRPDRPAPRVWLTWGRYERNVFGLDVAADGRRLFASLRRKGFEVRGGERNAGHTMAMWRRDLPAALEWAWGPLRAGAGPGNRFRRSPGQAEAAGGGGPDSGGT